jgi:hypothetical protein
VRDINKVLLLFYSLNESNFQGSTTIWKQMQLELEYTSIETFLFNFLFQGTGTVEPAETPLQGVSLCTSDDVIAHTWHSEYIKTLHAIT